MTENQRLKLSILLKLYKVVVGEVIEVDEVSEVDKVAEVVEVSEVDKVAKVTEVDKVAEVVEIAEVDKVAEVDGALIFRHVTFMQMNPSLHLPSAQTKKLQ
ncbi:unnamed protein product [Cercopithifilaria johnstoni]|uniref:Uncharacterized protein n=1 Tax=Cercopithifilaria johnstoni TaxID=2874296 RepID=A0A8J2Q719_9BILA|nr:unnamed protein product [Cercopithifilaria johnstoni]